MVRLIIAIIINLIIVILEIKASVNQYRHDGAKYFIYYTHLSNILAGITSLLFVIFGIAELSGALPIPAGLKCMRFMSTVMVALTFIVVITVLAPGRGEHGYRNALLKNNAKYVHLICPLLSVISFLFFEGGPKLDFCWTVIALIPTLIYGITAVVCNIRRIWDGPYGFLKVHDQTPVQSVLWGVIIISGAYLTGLLLWYLNSLIVQ